MVTAQFVTEDSRPILACPFCCAKIKQCIRWIRKCLEAEELFTQMMNETMREEELKELKRKRNRERQRAYYHRQRDLKKNEKKKEDRVPKSNAERQRAYYHRHKDLKKNEKKKKDRLPKSNAERQRKYRQRNAEKSYVDMIRQKLDSNEENVVQCRSVGNIENATLQENQFNSQQLQIYEQRYECITPEVILHRNTGIPGDGNCLFHSLISVLQLQIETCDLRDQLRDSPYLNYCHNPQEAYNILSSTNDYGDLDCLYLFSKMYNQNVCVHYCFYNISTTNQDTIFCHFKANDTKNWIHLYLREQHFTPLYEVKNEAHDDSNIQLLRDNHDNKGRKIKQEDPSEDSHNNHEIEIEIDRIGENIMDFIADGTIPVYTNYRKHSTSHIDFYKDFTSNSFGHSCIICDRLWWKRDLKMSTSKHENILKTILQNYTPGETVQVCYTCYTSLEKNKIPLMSTYNGFAYPEIPSHLPTLNLIEQRLISPRIPFMEIRRLRHVNGQYGMYGQIINVPIEVNTMVKQLPRNIQDDLCFYVHLKKKLIHKTSYVHGLINKSHIKQWLSYLVSTPLYTYHDIKIDDFLFTGDEHTSQLNMDEISEHVPNEDSLVAQQQTLLWNDDYFLSVAPGEHNRPVSILMDEHAEELSFPKIYGGQFRTYRDGVTVTPFMQATSELRRTDRRATDPQHLLYIAAKIMKLRVSRCVNVAFKHVGQGTSITKETIQSEEYINNCFETNLAFLRCIPNSAWFWSDRKKDLFAMIRQLGPPTAFMTLSANETGWGNLLKLLYKLKNEGTEISDEFLAEMSYIHKAQLVNEDAVTCAIYFNKMVNCLLKVMQSKKRSPFGKYRVVHYFQRIEFQHRGSSHAHILLWLENVPKDLLSNDPEVIKLIDELVSVSASEASGNIKLVTHKHTLTCYKKMNSNKKQECIFGAPFMPTKKTIYLIPMRDTDPDYSEALFKEYKKRFKIIRKNLENFDYTNFDEFYSHNDIISDDHYYNIIRAGINRPKLLYKRTSAEKWHNAFNPFILHNLKSNMDFQIILDEYACATYIVEYFNQNNRGISNLQKQIIDIMDEHPEFDIVDITKKMSLDIVQSVEMSVQEAAWYLLREPMAKSSVATVYIPTVLPTERARIRKSMKKLEAIDDDCMNGLRENWFDKYEKRPEELREVTLAQFVAKYYQNKKGNYSKRDTARIIRYRNYDMADNYNDYRREMVLLHVPFQSEENDIIAENKFIKIYEDNKDTILERRKEFESNLDIEKTLETYIQLCQENDKEQEDEEDLSPRDPLFQKLNPSTNHDPLEFRSGFIKCEVEHVSGDDGCQTESIAVKEELPDVCETQVDIIEPKEEYQSDDLAAENQDNTGLGIEDMRPHTSDSDSESDVPLTNIKIEVEEHIKIEVEEHKIKIEVEAQKIKTEVEEQIAEGTNRTIATKKAKLDTRRSKQEYTNTAELEENEQSNLKFMETTRNRTSRSDTYDKKPDLRSLYQVGDFREDTSKDICEKKDKIDSQYNLGNNKHLSALSERIGINTGERLFSCDVCQRSFRVKKYLIQHIRIHTGEKRYKCDLCQCSFARNGSLKSHMFKHTGEKPYKCDICQRSFTRSGDLKTHLLKHTVEKLHKCDICWRSFKRNYDLRKHILIHTGETPFKCNVCPRSFSRETHLTTHLRIHTGEKPFKCDICQRSFSDTSNLKTHIRIHTGETYKCDICQRSFTRSDNLRNHVRTHTGETPFKCNVCQRSFTRNDDLKTHILIHTGVKSYMCDVCPRSFTLKCNLIKHKRLHTGEKPYKCDICQHSFSRKHHLKIHIRTHTGEKPYKCNVCPCSFTRKGNLSKHTTKHTGE